MTEKLLRLSFLLLFSASSPFAFANEANVEKHKEYGLPFITNHTPQEYGADPVNWAMIQDDRGFIYGGNQKGLLEYDGSTWKLIKLPGNSNIRSFAKTSEGRVYVGGYGELGYLDADSIGQTKFVSIKDQIPEEYLPFNDVWYMHATPEGLYVNIHDKVLLLHGKEVKVWKSKTSFHISNYVHSQVYVREWESGLGKLTEDGFELLPGGEQFASERIYYILPYGEGRLLIGTVNHGLFISTENGFEPFRTEADDIFKSYEPYLPGAVLPNDRYALGTMGGGCIILDKDGRLIQKIDRSSGLQDAIILYPFVDRDNALWLGLSKGISRINIESPMTYFGEQHGLEGTVLTVKRFNGDLYVGNAVGVFRFDGPSNSFTPVQGLGGQCFDLKIFDGELLVTNYHGVHRIIGDKATPIRKSVNRDYVPFALIPSKVNKQRLVVALGEKAGSLFKQSDGTWIDEGFWSVGEGSSTNYSVQLDDGSWWLAFNKEVVYAEFPDQLTGPARQKPVLTRYNNADGLEGEGFTAWDIDGKTLFLSTKGLFYFDEGKRRFLKDDTFQEVEHLIDDATGFVTDHLNRVWIIGKELILAVPNEGGGFNFVSEPFRPIQDKIVSWVFPEEDGITWISTAEGLIRYDERMKVDYTGNFNTVLRKVETADGQLLSAQAGLLFVEPRIDYKNNSVVFGYAAPFYEQESKTVYQSMLDGFDKDWSAWNAKSERTYTNLHEGHYTFRVRSKNIFGDLGQESTFTFRVDPPWYRTWIAILLYILGGGAFVYGIVRIRTRQLKEKQRQLELTVDERTMQLKQRVEELAVINSVQGGLVAEMNMQGIYNLVGDKIRDIFDAQIVAIAIFDHEREMEEFQYLFEEGMKHFPEPRKMDELRRYLISQKEAVVARHFDEPVFREIGYKPKAVPGTQLPKSGIFMPLVVGEEVRGYISLQNLDRTNAFSDSDISLLSTLTNSMSVALENARLFDETNRLLSDSEQRAAEMLTVNNVSKALATQLDLETLIPMVGDQMRDLFEGQYRIHCFTG